MSIWFNRARSKWLYSLSWGVLIIVITSSLITPCTGLLLLQRGAEKLARAEQGERDPSLLVDSLVDLKRASELMPSNPLPLRYLARALRYSGRLDEAVAVLERAALLEPQSLLIRQELMFAYQLIGKRDEYLETDLNFNFDRCIAIGDGYLDIGDGVQALEWYDRASQLWPEQSEAILFRRWIALIQSNDGSAAALLPTVKANTPDLEIIYLNASLTIANGASMRRIPSGESLSNPYSPSEAVLWTNGRGSLIVSVDHPGLYLVKITTFDGGTPPIKMAFGVNGKITHTFLLVKGDNSWTIKDFQVMLNQPLVTLDIWFLNDIWIPNEGISRDVIVRQVEIQQISKLGQL